MQEVLFRDRNLRYAETLFHATQQQQILLLLLELIGLDPSELDARRKNLQAIFKESIRTYGAELYGDRYLPGAEAAEAERARVARLKALDDKRREELRIARVAKWSEE